MLPARRDIQDRVSFAITVDFVRGEGDPSRPFRTMIDMLDALASFDRDLVKGIDASIDAQLLLEDVESGSIKSWMLTVLESTDDNALRSGDWKKIVGSYAVRAKYIVIDWLKGAKKITEPGLLESIQQDLLRVAEQTDVRGLPGYTPMPRLTLAAHIVQIMLATSHLQTGDVITYESRDGAPVELNPILEAGGEDLTSLLMSRSVKNTTEMTLKVKKPDFTGHSMWEFHYTGHVIDAKVLDEEWLIKFQKEGLGVRPGSSLRAMVEIELLFDDADKVAFERYSLLKVLEVIPPFSPDIQLQLPSDTP
jgi:hypothetical protein